MLSFSVITPSFNQGKYIRQTIESVLAQKWPNFEHIIVDGGSTDETVAILKEYPHLKWISEKDNGQADALNKGLKMAKGDVIAWINSDDWYAEGAFQAVAPLLEKNPIAVGACDIVHEGGTAQDYRVANVERDLFDMIKYWTPYSIPTQPSIFLRRDALETVKRSDGEIIDSEFYYTMDYDLWMRLALRWPFAARVDKVLSYYRMTADNKTSSTQDNMHYAEPEMSRVFKRTERTLAPQHVEHSYVIPVRENSTALWETVDSLLRQADSQYEIILTGRKETLKQLRREISTRNEAQRERGCNSYIRIANSEDGLSTKALNQLAYLSGGTVITLVTPGVKLPQNYYNYCAEVFANDRAGMLLPWGSLEGAAYHFGQGPFQIDKLFTTPTIPHLLSIRRVTLADLRLSEHYWFDELSLRLTILCCAARGWHIDLRTVPDTIAKQNSYNKEILEACMMYSNASLLKALDEALAPTPFSAMRLTFGIGLQVPSDLKEAASKILKNAPPNWEKLVEANDPQVIQETTNKYPSWSPGWFMWAKHLERIDNSSERNLAINEYQKAFQNEVSY